VVAISVQRGVVVSEELGRRVAERRLG
jgi:hypothetical protein